MKSSEILSNTDRTSWTRVLMVMKYFRPSLLPVVIIYPLLAIALALMIHFFGGSDGNNPWAYQLLSVVAYAIMFAPCFLSRQSTGEAFYSLPALGWEKCEAIFLMMFIGVPLLFTPLELYDLICGGRLSLETYKIMGVRLQVELSAGMIYLSTVTMLTSVGAAIWAVFAARRHRALKAFGAAISFMFVDFIFGIVIGFMSAISDSRNNVSPGDMIKEYTSYFMPVMGTFWTIVLLFVLYKASRAISRKQI